MAQTAAYEVRKTVDIVTLQKNSETNTLLTTIPIQPVIPHPLGPTLIVFKRFQYYA